MRFALEAKGNILGSLFSGAGSLATDITPSSPSVTSSCYDIEVRAQAFNEIVYDGHPGIILSEVDIAGILNHLGYNTKKSLEGWLKINFPC